MKDKLLALLAVGLLGLLGWWMFVRDTSSEEPPPVKTLTGLEERMQEEDITRLTYDPNTQELIVREEGRDNYRVAAPAVGDKEGIDQVFRLAQKEDIPLAGVPLEVSSESLGDRLLRIIPSLLIVGIIIYFAVQYAGFGKRRIEHAKSDTTFDDVAGCGEAISELKDVREFLKDPKKFSRLGARVPKGVLLYGPPGSGKTLLSKATASEAGAPFFSVSGSEFIEMYAGLGARRVRQLFEKAKKEAPSIIFIDELDAVGGKRSKGQGDGGVREADQTLIQILNEMDGFEVQEHPVIVIGATNRLETLDPALIRPGRFDRHIAVDPPDKHGRLEILEVHAKGKRIGQSVDLRKLANQTAGMTGAELELILNEAALRAARRGAESVEARDIDDAYFRVVAGAERQHQTLNQDERRRVAYHEAGHAIVRESLKGSQEVHKISIIPRGRSGGQTLIVSSEDVSLYSESDLRDHIAGLLAGRAAEEIVFGAASSGAADDLEKASELSEQMVTKLGMGKTLGLRVEHPEKPLSPELRRQIEEETRDLMMSEYDRTRTLLQAEEETLKLVAETLLEEETIDRTRFLQLLGK